MDSGKPAAIDKTIVFTGFMGAGKTTLGREVAHRLGRTFVDVDEKIVQDFGMSIPDIFKTHGEPAFRARERELVFRHCEASRSVLSLGGGAFLQEDIRAACLRHCIVVYLDIDWHYWVNERYHLVVDSRPLLQQLDLEEIHQLFQRRRAVYQAYHTCLKLDYSTADRAVDLLLELICEQMLTRAS
ncbi:shikimate kinase [Alicyclobacillus shizuokensis]|uniref:shikimate kinase n=1 Tax=Alicyclobacillus shizuokensis TaxID=392014 RepID=UPI00082B64A5|nr:shikimate kinase [Alicyclobacillus shizuokensis]MCL6627242.1 shikimate kinase [Alicyclobacillus shizuokensis]